MSTWPSSPRPSASSAASSPRRTVALGGYLRRRHQDRRPLRHHEVPHGARAWCQCRPRHRRQADRAHQRAGPHPLLRRILPGVHVEDTVRLFMEQFPPPKPGATVHSRVRQMYLGRLKLLQRACTKYFLLDMEHRFCQAMVNLFKLDCS